VKRFVNPPLGARSRRLDSHDYRGGAYFVTTNAKKRILSFGTIERGRMYLNECGRIVAEEWQRTGDLRDEVSLDAFIVMPDHVHGLLWICHSDNDQEEDETRRKHHFQEGKQKTKDCEGEARTSREENREVPAGKDGREMHLATSSELPPGLEKRRAGTLSTIMGCFKAAATRRINEKRDAPGETIWQSSFHDHIVRNRKELHRIRRYIRTNPQQESRS
jgi:REP element-mobilizing transposase RayT